MLFNLKFCFSFNSLHSNLHCSASFTTLYKSACISSISIPIISVLVSASQYKTSLQDFSSVRFLFLGNSCLMSCLRGGGTETWVGSDGSFNDGTSSTRNFLPLELTKWLLHTLVEFRIGRFCRPILCFHYFRRASLLTGRQ